MSSAFWQEKVDECYNAILQLSNANNYGHAHYNNNPSGKRKYEQIPGSPSGVIDAAAFSSDDGSNDSWAVAVVGSSLYSSSSSSEPVFKKSKTQGQKLKLSPLNRVIVGIVGASPWFYLIVPSGLCNAFSFYVLHSQKERTMIKKREKEKLHPKKDLYLFNYCGYLLIFPCMLLNCSSAFPFYLFISNTVPHSFIYISWRGNKVMMIQEGMVSDEENWRRTKLANEDYQHHIICFRHFLLFFFNSLQWISSRPYQIWTYLYHISIINWEQFLFICICFYSLPCVFCLNLWMQGL